MSLAVNKGVPVDKALPIDKDEAEKLLIPKNGVADTDFSGYEKHRDRYIKNT